MRHSEPLCRGKIEQAGSGRAATFMQSYGVDLRVLRESCAVSAAGMGNS